MHQNTTHFTSKEENTQGSIGTTTLVPYSLIQIHGWMNPKVAESTGLTEPDLKLLFEGMWYGTSGDGSSHSRSKVGQNSVLILEIVYGKHNQKIYGIDRLIELKPKDDKKSEQIRSIDDYDLDFGKLFKAVLSEKIISVRYYTEIESIKSLFTDSKKLKEALTFVDIENDKKVKIEPTETDIKNLFQKFELINFNETK